ncbi:hypothetical protein [Micromonospora sp. SH-82]|uniref:hypothetical protein n=1 Tax=Micromonospora sp. SH-82 TaxID=3132938 RepID=UPI003EC15465
MSSYRDPTLRGDVYPSEEEIDPTGIDGPTDPVGPTPSTDTTGWTDPTGTAPAPVPGPTPAPVPGPVPSPSPNPGPPPRTEAGQAIVTHHLDGTVQVITVRG